MGGSFVYICMATTTGELGARCEERAADFLRCCGYRVLERNYRTKTGEIDIVARDRDTIVFVEVRARASPSFGGAAETVGPVKRRKLIKTALAYVSARRLDCPLRFDVIAVEAGRLEHICDAFQT